VDTPDQDKLISSRLSPEEIAAEVGADSVAFISMDGLYKALDVTEGRNKDAPQFCDACFSGEYPIAPDQTESFTPQIREVKS